jgi:hypothetical protein
MEFASASLQASTMKVSRPSSNQRFVLATYVKFSNGYLAYIPSSADISSLPLQNVFLLTLKDELACIAKPKLSIPSSHTTETKEYATNSKAQHSLYIPLSPSPGHSHIQSPSTPHAACIMRYPCRSLLLLPCKSHLHRKSFGTTPW